MFATYLIVFEPIFWYYFIDYLIFTDLYVGPTEAIRSAIIDGYFPTWINNYYTVEKLENLGHVMADASKNGHFAWVSITLAVTHFFRQFVPISGLYYVELLTGKVLGIFWGFLLAWTAEVLGQAAQFGILLLFKGEEHRCFWTHMQLLLSGRTTIGPNHPVNSITVSALTRVKLGCVLAVVRCISPVPNWVFAHAIITLNIPFREYILSAMLAAIPHLGYSITEGASLEPNSKLLFDYGRITFTALFIGWVVIFVTLIMLVRRHTESEPKNPSATRVLSKETKTA